MEAEHDDEELLARVVNRDQAAYEALYERYEEVLRSHIGRMLRDPQATEDLVQETLLRVWTRADQYPGRGPFRAWLLRVATNLALNAMRSQRRRRECALELPAEPSDPDDQDILVPAWMVDTLTPSPDARIERSERHELLHALIRRLPEGKRDVIRLIYEADLDVRGAASALAIPEGTVKSRLHHATRELARRMAELELD